MLVRLIYASRVNEGLGPSDIDAILTTSRARNARSGVTGALCVTGSMFLQCLEGGREEVNATYHRIVADRRHRDVLLLGMKEVSERDFSEWSMEYIACTAENRALFLRFCPRPEFDPYAMPVESVDALFRLLKGMAR
jgi:hypothetical protein